MREDLPDDESGKVEESVETDAFLQQLQFSLSSLSAGSAPGLSVVVSVKSSADQVDFECFPRFISASPILTDYSDLILKGEQHIAQSNKSNVIDIRRKLTKLMNGNFEGKRSDLIDNLLIKQWNILVRRAVADTRYNQPGVINMFMFVICRICFTIDLLKKEKEAEFLLVSPIEYGAIFEGLNNITKIASRLTSPELAFALYQIGCEIILPFFIDRVWMVNKHKGESGFDIKPIDLKIEPAAMQTRYAGLLIKRGDLLRAQEICSQITKWYQPTILEVPESCKQILKVKEKTFTAKFREDKKTWQQFEGKNNRSYTDEQLRKDEKSLTHALYATWLKLEFAEKIPNLDRAVCYLEIMELLAEELSLKPDKSHSEVQIINLTSYFLEMAKHFEAKGAFNKAALYYSKAKIKITAALSYSESVKIQGKKIVADDARLILRSDLNSVTAKFAELKVTAFGVLCKDWHEQLANFAHLSSVKFDQNQMSILIHCKDERALKIYEKHFKTISIRPACNRKMLSMTIECAYLLSAKQLNRTFSRAEREISYALKMAEMAAQAKSAPDTEPNNMGAEHQSNFFVVVPSNRQLNQRVKPKQPRRAQQQPQRVNRAVPELQQEIIDWGEDFPNYTEDSGVYPIPNDAVKNVPLVKGVFFGYIPDFIRDQLDVELFDRFMKQLEQGSFSNQSKAQGIRSVSSELGQNPDNDYLFKINIGREDLRLYGRKVATVIVNGAAKVLICFDQLVPHNKELRFEARNDREENSSSLLVAK